MADLPQPKSNEEDIQITEVTKVFKLGLFKKKVGVENLSLAVPRGRIIGLLGPNGSGKSTTIKMILGFLKPTSGEILVCGHSAESRRARKFIGYLPENPRFQKFLSATDILSYYGKLLNLGGRELSLRIDELLRLVKLEHAAHERVQGFSKGMTQRLAIAQSLLGRPSLLIFDEPMSGLDPIGRREIRQLIWRIHEELPSTTIFFSTHILGDVEELCSAVAVIRKGRLTHFSPIEELILDEVNRFDIVIKDAPTGLNERLKREHRSKETPMGLCFSVDGIDQLMTRLAEIRHANASVVSVASHRRNLEEALFTEGPAFESAGSSTPPAPQSVRMEGRV